MLCRLSVPAMMNWLMYLSWATGPVLETVLLGCMVHRKLHRVFPRFFSYVVFQILKSALLFLTYRFNEEAYFDAYWTGSAISVVLAVTVMEMILVSVAINYGGSAGQMISLAKSVAYNVVTLLWIAYLYQQAHSIPAVEMTPGLEVALANPAAGPEAFTSMVERAVEE